MLGRKRETKVPRAPLLGILGKGHVELVGELALAHQECQRRRQLRGFEILLEGLLLRGFIEPEHLAVG